MQTEKEFAQAVVELARLRGWWEYRVWNSRHSPAGWPDLVLLRPPRIIFAELKTDKGKLTEAQRETLAMLEQCCPHSYYEHDWSVHVWRPADWDVIERELK